MRVIDTPSVAFERICLYGAPKVGKTTLATALPWGEYWGEKAIYIASDVSVAKDASEEAVNRAAGSALKPVMDPTRLRVVLPEGKPSWMEEAVQIARSDFGPEIKTIIWDTMTETSKRILREYSDLGVFSSKHAVQVGNRATGSWHTSPMEGDYGAAQNTIAFIHEALWLQPRHLIVIFHEDFAEPESGSVDGLVGGPATIGKKAIRWIPAKYDTVLYMQRIQSGPEKSNVVVNTVQRGIWPAGIRTNRTTTIASQVTLARNPTSFWETLAS